MLPRSAPFVQSRDSVWGCRPYWISQCRGQQTFLFVYTLLLLWLLIFFFWANFETPVFAIDWRTQNRRTLRSQSTDSAQKPFVFDPSNALNGSYSYFFVLITSSELSGKRFRGEGVVDNYLITTSRSVCV